MSCVGCGREDLKMSRLACDKCVISGGRGAAPGAGRLWRRAAPPEAGHYQGQQRSVRRRGDRLRRRPGQGAALMCVPCCLRWRRSMAKVISAAIACSLVTAQLACDCTMQVRQLMPRVAIAGVKSRSQCLAGPAAGLPQFSQELCAGAPGQVQGKEPGGVPQRHRRPEQHAQVSVPQIQRGAVNAGGRLLSLAA